MVGHGPFTADKAGLHKLGCLSPPHTPQPETLTKQERSLGLLFEKLFSEVMVFTLHDSF